MRPYEVMIIFDPGLEDAALQRQVDRCTEVVTSRGATVGRVERWGRRRLAYELQHHRDGYYVVMEATAEPVAMDELDRALHLADEVLRHKVMRIPDKVAARPRPSVIPADDGAASAPAASGPPAGGPPAAEPGPGARAAPSERDSSSVQAPPETSPETPPEVPSGNGDAGPTAEPGAAVAAAEAADDSSDSANGA